MIQSQSRLGVAIALIVGIVVGAGGTILSKGRASAPSTASNGPSTAVPDGGKSKDDAKSASVSPQNIRLKANGVEMKPEKPPIIHEGTTYVPVQAVAQAVGMKYEWDSKTSTVLLNTHPDHVALSKLKITEVSLYEHSVVEHKRDGTTYPDVLRLKSGEREGDVGIDLALDRAYAQVDLTLMGVWDYYSDPTDGSVRVSLDGNKPTEIKWIKGNDPTKVSLPVENAVKLRITVPNQWNTVYITGAASKKGG